MLPNFQFSIFNFQSKLKLKFLKFRDSFQISNFKFQIILVFFLLSTFYLLPPSFAEASAGKSAAFASATPQQASYPAPNTNPDVQNNLHNWTQSVMIEVMSSLTCQIAGVDPINPKQSCLGADQTTGKIGFLPTPQAGGAIGFMGNMITALYTPPLHTVDYFQNLAQNFGITKKTYAAPDTGGGTGFKSLTPLIGIWTAFRNIVYLILVIVFVIIGLAIMLRVKIDPRTVMSIQNQIPKIIVGILAVTFSFAIAGFLIDMMWVLIYLIHNVISQAAGNPPAIQAVSIANFNGTPFGALGGGNIMSILWTVSFKTGVTLANFLGIDSMLNIIKTAFSGRPWWETVLISINPVGLVAGMGMGVLMILQGVIGVIGGILVFIIISIALLVALFRLWFTLIMAYVQILLGVVLAPFWIIGGIVPGSPISLGGWFKNMAANLLAFPVTIAMFMFAVIFKDIFGRTPSGPIFVPPLVGNPGDFDPAFIGPLISLGIVLMTPNVVSMLKAALKAPKTDTGIGKAIGAGNPLALGQGLGQLGSTWFGVTNIPGVKSLPGIRKLYQDKSPGTAPGGGGH